ncbi:hypothetical protein BGP76_06075 [Reichenbachiella sp. MSK19-1]|nr:hypothetical protein BGP76_06075 [Reichenbachiella sp. MSK19-1]
MTPAYAQIIKSSARDDVDSVKIKADRFLFMGDEVFYIRRDTIIPIWDTTDYYIRKKDLDRSKVFYDSIETKMSRSKMSSMVYDALFVNPKDGKSGQYDDGMSEFRFLAYEDKVISPLKFKHINIFGSSFNDTTRNRVDKYTNLINKTHIHTQKWVIRSMLTFKEGGYINAQALVDSERLLRSRRFIRASRIMLNPVYGEDSVEVHVVTRDVFPFALAIRPNNGNGALVGLSNVNIAGLGHKLEYNYISDGGSEIYYDINNLFATYIDIGLDWSYHFRKQGFGVTGYRGFLTQNIRYAGGMELSKFIYGDYRYDPIADFTETFHFGVNRAMLWLGHAIPVDFRLGGLGFSNSTNFVVSAGLDMQDYYDKPFVSADSNYIFQDRYNYLMQVGLSSRNYYKDKYVINYGRTEDIPSGAAVSLVVGFQRREFVDRFFVGGNYSRGGYIHGFGYLNSKFSLGAFLDGNHIEDGAFNANFDYFTSLQRVGSFRLRQFVDIAYSQAINPSEDIYIRGQNELGIRNVSGFYLKGTSKLNVKYEALMFTPFNVLSFRIAALIYGEATMVGNSVNDFFDTDVYAGVGVGLTFSNDNLAISTITMRLGYYPNLPLNANSSWYELSTSNRLSFRDFDLEGPELIEFR